MENVVASEATTTATAGSGGRTLEAGPVNHFDTIGLLMSKIASIR